MLLLIVPQILEYVSAAGVSPFAKWRERLDATVRARVTVAIYRLETGNFSAAKDAGAVAGVQAQKSEEEGRWF